MCVIKQFRVMIERPREIKIIRPSNRKGNIRKKLMLIYC